MINVNTIEFAGRKAVLNSFSDHPLLVADMTSQRERWAVKFPNAIVRTERMTEAACMALVAASGEHHADRWNAAHKIARLSVEEGQ